MDTLKKEIYIEARRLLESKEHDYLCCALKDAACTVLWLSDIYSDSTLHELFPEFIAMYDGKYWHQNSEKFDRVKVPSSEITIAGWWDQGWPEPRLAIIDYLLSR